MSIDKFVDNVLSIKFVVIVFVLFTTIMTSCSTQYLLERNRAADKYIQELEEVLEINGIEVADVCGGDGYNDYYSK